MLSALNSPVVSSLGDPGTYTLQELNRMRHVAQVCGQETGQAPLLEANATDQQGR
jgi:hypothetical protein